jgi:hypothetical protein
VRRATALTLAALFLLLVVAAVAQLTLASGGGAPLPGPSSVGQLPVTSTPASSAP